MKFITSILFVLLTTLSFAFEGTIHCVKTENGVVTKFDFYVKGNTIVVEKRGIGEYYKIIFNRDKQEVKICLESPQFSQKGYYLLTKADMENSPQSKIYSQKELAPQQVGEVSFKAYSLVSDLGSVIGLVGEDQVDLRGLSTFFQDPVYELIDQFNLSQLPRKLEVTKNTGNYTIELEAEAGNVNQSLCEVPAGYTQFQVTALVK
ncbi:hypothetical protein [Fluviicola taffensis]|uniref:hypothetical protein n=1 Tax=Fluviicola taffensis TaxID=191579 RepID=UPI0031378E08